MRIIKYRPSDSNEFDNYIDIGVCERDYYFINFFLEGEHEIRSGKVYFPNYHKWFENFKKETMGSKMVIIHYYLSEYMGWNFSENTPRPAYFEEVYGAKTLSVVSNNLDYLLQFQERWFYDESSLFKGLDLAFDDIEDRFTSTVENEDGIRIEIEFDDGSKIQFLDENDSYKSFFVPEEDYKNLKSQIERIVTMFQP
uniref:hypothetical protein n=1 Tax=Algoriphagus sp. TaxID=1872435 RepID=UPI00404832A4